MRFGSVYGGDNGEHNGVSFVVTSHIFEAQVSFFFEMESFDRVYICHPIGLHISYIMNAEMHIH